MHQDLRGSSFYPDKRDCEALEPSSSLLGFELISVVAKVERTTHGMPVDPGQMTGATRITVNVARGSGFLLHLCTRPSVSVCILPIYIGSALSRLAHSRSWLPRS